MADMPLPAIRLDDLRIDPPLALAPMAGVTDRPWRVLCREQGAGLAVAEMINSQPQLRHTRKSALRTVSDDEAAPRSMQILGNDPQDMAETARYCVDQGAQIVDINLGCPAKKVCRRAAGSALMDDEPLVARILEAVVQAVPVPVTLKMRTGTCPERRNAARIAQLAEAAGIRMLAVHGRTRADLYRGEAEYDTLAEVCAAVRLPVLANGDIDSVEKARAVLAHTGAAGVMIGRGALGRPWLFRELAAWMRGEPPPGLPAPPARLSLMQRHLEDMVVHYGEAQAVRVARKHVGWYAAGLGATPDWQAHFNCLTDASAQRAALDDLFATPRHHHEAA